MLVSIILPTYNRADTIRRTIESVKAQWWTDWELIVVDDGSTDGTRDRIAGADPRMRVISQTNQGVSGARNRGMQESRGGLIAFIDSDDEMPPHHVALASAFFAAHPREHLYTSEFWEDFGGQKYVKHPREEIGNWYPETARHAGLRTLETEVPDGDGYLRIYQSREPVGAWARPVLDRTPYESVFHYRGDVFKGWKWGWLTAMQPTVLTRAAMEANGPLDTSFPIAACFGYLAKLCRRYTTNLISAPGCIKHEYGAAGEALKQEHVVSGRSAPLFHGDVLRWHEELFSSADPSDHDAQVMRGFRQYLLARACAQWGRRDQALKLLDEAMKTYPMPEVRRLRRLLRLVPNASASRAVFRGVTSLGYRMSRLASRLRRRG